MMTLSSFPILSSINVSPQVCYEFICDGVEAERIKYHTHQVLGDESAAMNSYKKLLQGERLLSFMRTRIIASKV